MRIRLHIVPVAILALALGTLAQGGSALAATGGWQVVPSPGGPVAGLAATSFTAPDDGWAVGSSGQSLAGTGIDTLIEHWDGAGWEVVPSLSTPQSDEALSGVTSTGPDDAWAVGWQDPYGTTRIHALLMHWDGVSWSVAQGPPGAGIVRAIDARTPSDVWAVGSGLFEHFDGSRWSVVPAPQGDANPAAVTALAADNVWAVGTQRDPRPGYRSSKPYIAHWDGAAWSSVAVPPVSGQGSLASVSAVGPSDIWAVGSVGPWPTLPYALHYNGVSWQRVAIAVPRNGSSLSGVTALSSDDVWAVGSRTGTLPNGYAVLRTFTEHWDGAGWSIVASPNDSDQDNHLDATTAAGGRVWAVGGDGGTLVERR